MTRLETTMAAETEIVDSHKGIVHSNNEHRAGVLELRRVDVARDV